MGGLGKARKVTACTMVVHVLGRDRGFLVTIEFLVLCHNRGFLVSRHGSQAADSCLVAT